MLSQAEEERLIQVMLTLKGFKSPSHLFFAYDIFLFIKGNTRNINNLLGILIKYQNASCQVVNKDKSRLFLGGISGRKKAQIIRKFGIQEAGELISYLGVAIFKGRVKREHVWPVVEKILGKISS